MTGSVPGPHSRLDQKPSTAAEPIPPGPGLVDPRALRPGEPPEGPGTPLEVEPLPGPTEASEDVSLPDDASGTGLFDPRSPIPGPGEPMPDPAKRPP